MKSILLLIITCLGCGKSSDSDTPQATAASTPASTTPAETIPATTQDTASTPAPVINYPGVYCTNFTAAAIPANIADKKVLNSILVGDTLGTMITEAKTILLDPDRTTYESLPDTLIQNCERAEAYTYHAYTAGPLSFRAFEFKFWFCASKVSKILYCPSVDER